MKLVLSFPSHLLSPSVTIDSLYKVTEGGQSDIFHRHADGSFDPACCFTVYHGNHMESLDLVTSNAEEARTWITGLRYLMAGISDEDSLAKRQRTHDQYPLNKELHTNHRINYCYICFHPPLAQCSWSEGLACTRSGSKVGEKVISS